MLQRRSVHRLLASLSLAACAALATPAPADAAPTQSGFTLNRYEPTAAGEWSFWVDHPWYSSTRYFAAGITLNYGHNPLQFGRDVNGVVDPSVSVIQHQLLGHVDLAGSFLDRVLITASLPVTLLERGTEAGGVAPTQGVVVGDPRLGLWVRLFGQPYRSGISMSLGANVWVPLRQFTGNGVSNTSSDSYVRVQPKLVLGGLANSFMWSFTGSFLYRAPAKIGTSDPLGSTIGSELQFGLALAYASTKHRLAIGPEAMLSTVVLGNDEVKPQPFGKDYTSLEVLLGLHHNIAKVVNIGIGGGIGLLRTPGTPDARLLFRLAYAPIRDRAPDKPKDRDQDGVLDVEDACPDVPGITTGDPATQGCPDRDKDRIIDRLDQCPDEPMGVRPDPERLGCPQTDRDKDGVIDSEDKCPDVPKGDRPDVDRPGCPLGDRDSDGVLDPDDVCPDEAQGSTPDPNRTGCPAGDRDSDGVIDPSDMCPDEPQGTRPDPRRAGCPLPDKDSDGDRIMDSVDACPNKPGMPSPDPAKHGCPSLVEFKDGKISIMQPVFFATDKDEILEKSYPVLNSVADVLIASKDIRQVAIEGHTDNRGKAQYNRDLSERRAFSVLRFLVARGVEEGRLQAAGFGPDRPITSNATPAGREKNRRVEFVILDPPQTKSVKSLDASQVSVPDSPDQSDGTKKKAAPKRRPPAKKGK